MPKTNLADAAKAVRARKAKKAAKPEKTPKVAPTPEREAHNEIQSAGMAARITPPIETMRNRGQLTAEEFATLRRYSLALITAYGSETRSCCDNSVRGGGGDGPSEKVTRARLFVGAMESRSGPHVSLVRAICREEHSLTRWCIDKYGSRERVRNGKIELRPIKDGLVKAALVELKDAAKRMGG